MKQHRVPEVCGVVGGVYGDRPVDQAGRRLPACAVDDLHARRERGAAGADGALPRRLGAVVLGGTSILGGSGRQSGTAVGTSLIVPPQRMLAGMRMPEAGRQIIHGPVIFGMLLLS